MIELIHLFSLYHTLASLFERRDRLSIYNTINTDVLRSGEQIKFLEFQTIRGKEQKVARICKEVRTEVNVFSVSPKECISSLESSIN